MIYIVGGSQRTGTSMVMRALMAGGLTADFDPKRDAMNERHGDEHYKPNAGGFYELQRAQYQAIGFPRAHEGKLIKILNEGILKIAPRSPEDPYRIVFMRRDPEEMRQSWEAFFGPQAVHPGLRVSMDDILGVLHLRADCVVVSPEYRAVVAAPLAVFEYLAAQGWPIDPEAAVATIDPALCHMRREELAVGA